MTEKKMRALALVSAAIGIGCMTVLSCLKTVEAPEAAAYEVPGVHFINADYEEALAELAVAEETTAEETTAEETAAAVQEETTVAAAALNTDDYLLAKIAMAEAEGEGVEGKALVICVVFNRVASDSFPDTVKEVIFQEGQFASTGTRWETEPDDECFEALEMVRAGWDESEGALYFEAIGSAGTWQSENRTRLFTCGSHVFYK